MKRLFLAAALAPLAFVPAARADEEPARCGNVPIADWMSEADMRSRAASLGLAVQRVDIDEGCYEVKATNADGRNLEVLFNPQTGEQVSVDGGADHGDHDGEGH